MRLSTRISGFEWLLVGLLVAVSALSIELIGSGSRTAARIILHDERSLLSVAAMRGALWAHEIAAARVRLGEGRAQEMYDARTRFSRALEQAQATAGAPALLEAIATLSDRYFAGEVTLDAALEAIATLESETRERIESEAANALSTGKAGVRLIASAGAIALLLAIFLAARVSRRITQPIETLHRTLVAIADGENVARRVPDGDFDETLRELGRAVNLLADRLEELERKASQDRVLLEAAAAHLIEQVDEPFVVTDLSGALRLSNAKAREILLASSPADLGIPEAVASALENGGRTGVTRLVAPTGRPVAFALALQRGNGVDSEGSRAK